MTQPGPLVPFLEFGPLDVLRELAYRCYIDGRYDQALWAVSALLPYAEQAGDHLTARYLRYIACVTYEMSGQWSKLRRDSEELLQRLGPDAGPYWRAKVLGELSHALIVQGSASAAMDSLAEAYGLVTDRDSQAYNRGSACHVVSVPLSAALLFGPALKLIREAQQVLGPRSGGDINGAIEEAFQLATWGLFLEFLGRRRAAASRYRACASAAVRAEELSRSRGLTKQELQARSMLQFAYLALDLDPVDLPALRRYVALDSGRDALIPRLALVATQLRDRDLVAARAGIVNVRADAQRLGEPVLAWVAAAWLAELEESQDGGTQATRRWRELALATLERLWRDRAGRFEDLVSRHRVATLSRRVEDDGLRLWEDALTAVGNRRLLDALMAVPESATRPVAFVDVDHFKLVNDRYGHEIGDEVLRRIAVLLQALCRSGDVVIRYGGDEFVVVLAEDGDAVALAYRVRAAVARFSWDDIAPGLRVTVTVGASPGGSGSLERADAALIAAKARRRPSPPHDPQFGDPQFGDPQLGDVQLGDAQRAGREGPRLTAR